jgi:hypothetical protein
MANVLNKFSRMYTYNIAELVSEAPITVRKAIFRPARETQTAILQTCDLSATPDCDAILVNVTVASTSAITDDDSGDPFDGAAVGDWLEITDCTTTADNGWYLIKTYTDTNGVAVEDGINALTDGSSITMHIRVFSPEDAMMFVADDASTAANNSMKHELDWGDRGRIFSNLSMKSISSTTCALDIYIA